MRLKQTWKVENHWHPELREKPNRSGRSVMRLVRSLTRLKYSEEFSPVSSKGGIQRKIPNASWADWDHNGRLVYCRGGKIFGAQVDADGIGEEKELADFNSAKPEPVVAPRWATIW